MLKNGHNQLPIRLLIEEIKDIKLLDYLEIFFSTYGYIAVFTVLILCGFGLPVPEDITLVAGGLISGLGQANLLTMILVSLAGVLIGDGLMFTMGRFFGPKLLQAKWISKILTPDNYQKVQEKFDRYGNSVIFVGRFLPGLRTPIYITAGMSHKISYFQFFMMDGFAALISVPLWVWVGHYCAENKELLLEILNNFKIIIFILIGLILIAFLTHWFRKRRNKKDLRTKKNIN